MPVNKTSLMIALISVVLLSSCQSGTAVRPQNTATPVDLTALYTLPSLIGTAPAKPVWPTPGFFVE